MKVTVEQIPPSLEEHVEVHCHNSQSQWVQDIRQLQDSSQSISGKIDDMIYNVSLSNIYYFEVVDDHSFFYTKNQVFESRLKLYEFENLAKNLMFFKAAKNTIVNIRKIKCIKPSYSGKFELTLLNEYKIMVSRLYVSQLKQIMGL